MSKSLLQDAEDRLLFSIAALTESLNNDKMQDISNKINLISQLASAFNTVRGYNRNTMYSTYNLNTPGTTNIYDGS